MTKVSVKGNKLAVEIEGLDKLWAFQNRLEIPLAHVRDVRVAEKEHWYGCRAPGIFIPGVIAAGIFYKKGQKRFCDVHDFAQAIAIDLQDDRYPSLILEVADLDKTIAGIRGATGK